MIVLLFVPAFLFALAMWATLSCLQPAEKSKDHSIGPTIAAVVWLAFVVGSGLIWYLINQPR